jgi:hypothetical protein
MNFITKLNSIVEELKSNPAFCVTHYAVLPPNMEAIEKVESSLGYKLDATITDFYKECGGVQLLWFHESNDGFKENQEGLPTTSPLKDFYIKGGDMVGSPDGAIWIPSIESVFLHDWSNDGLEFDMDSFDESITNNYEDFKIQVFDWFSDFNDVAFLMNGTANPPMVLGDDHQATYNDSHLIDFNLYLELLLKSKGSCEMRADFLNIYSNKEIKGTVTLKDIEKLKFSV